MQNTRKKANMHPDDRRNLIIFALLFAVIYLLFDIYFLRPHMDRMDAYHAAKTEGKITEQSGGSSSGRPDMFETRDDALNASTRVPFDTESFFGSVNLRGAVIDDIRLHNYYLTLEGKEEVAILSPEGTPFPRYAEAGWVTPDGTRNNLPDAETLWTVTKQNETGMTLTWTSPQGVRFEQEFVAEDKFLIRLTQRVYNNTSQELTLFPFTLITEHGLPEKLTNRWVIHEGPVGFINQKLEERQYKDMPKERDSSLSSTSGWIGFTEQYWLASILPPQDDEKTFRFSYRPSQMPGRNARFQVDVMGDAHVIPAGATTEYSQHIFTGAKELQTLTDYSKRFGIPGFESAIDFGWFWFLTKPFLRVMLWINGIDFIDHFAVTILIFAFLLRLAVFPLANTSFRSFAKLKVITPKIMEIQQTYGDDKVKMQQEMVELYKKEKVNPAAGCLPILIQIPIFFSLFKVLNVAIEMRHEPGLFWIHDLSAPDPTSLFNLFGLLPYDVPAFLVIGAWPCLMMLTLVLQQSMNPPPTDPMVAKMFRFMPIFLAFIMSGLAAGLVMYYTFSNLLSITQQYVINRMMGVKVVFFQGWFGRPHQEPTLAQASANMMRQREEAEKANPDREYIAEEINEVLEDVAEGGHVPPEITPPKPKKSKKKK